MPSLSSHLTNNHAAKILSMVLFGDFSRSGPKRHHLSPSCFLDNFVFTDKSAITCLHQSDFFRIAQGVLPDCEPNRP